MPAESPFRLAQFNGHWGSCETRGSEHTVNGQSFAAEIHLVFWNCAYKKFEIAMKQPDGLAVIGVFLEQGAAKGSELEKVTQGSQILFC